KAGVVDQDVDAPCGCLGLLDRRVIGHVEPKLLGDVEIFERLGLPRGRNDLEAALRELDRRRAADTRRAAGDEYAIHDSPRQSCFSNQATSQYLSNFRPCSEKRATCRKPKLSCKANDPGLGRVMPAYARCMS